MIKPKINKPLLLIFSLIGMTLILFFSSPSTALMLGLSMEELVSSSDLVISGEIKDTESFWSEDGKTILTSATLLVENTIKGDSTQNTVIVEHEGGEIGGIGLKVSDISPLIKGEKIVLLLKSAYTRKRQTGRRPGTSIEKVYNIVGEAQGKYLIDSKGMTTRSGFSIAAGKDVIDNNLPLNELIKRIKDLK